MTRSSEHCDYIKFSNLRQLPCDFYECSSSDVRYRAFGCKACGKVNIIDIEAASQQNFIGLRTFLLLVGIILVILGTGITTQPENHSVPSSQDNILRK